MQTVTVKDLMVPLEEYATVSEEATLYEAVMALEKAQEELDRSRYHYLHRAVVVLDKNGKVLGKISQLDALRALEPKYAKVGEPTTISRAGFSPQFLKNMLDQYALFRGSLDDICSKAAEVKVKSFVHAPSEGEFVSEDATLAEAIHMILMGQRQSLLVTRGDDIVGILRLTDIFKEVFQRMKACKM